MLRTLTITVLGLSIAALGPMAVFSGPDMWKTVKDKVSGLTATTKAKPNPDVTVSAAQTLAKPFPAGPPELALEGSATRELADVLRFNISPGWVTQSWPRVSTGLAHLQMQGYRVPLVTGTGEGDLAGSLTYYFGPHQKLQRISFQGSTGNANKLVKFLTTKCHFTRRITNDAALFLYEVPDATGRVRSQLAIRSAQVLRSGQPLQRFDISLVIERPE